MSDQKNPTLMATLTGRTGEPPSRAMLIARTIAIAVPVIGATPTAFQLYQSWKHNIPYSQVAHRLAQYDLWLKNFDCKIEYKALNTGQTRVDAGACPKSGDIAIRISLPNGKATHEWIAFEQLQKASMSASVVGLFISGAHAQGLAPGAAPGAPKSLAPVQLAQSGPLQVVCQSIQPQAKVVRIVNEGGKCYRETIAAIQGRTERREEVPCNTQCPAPAR